MMKLRFSIFMIVITLLASQVCLAKTPPKKTNIMDLEGRWKVVSSTWGGNPADFLQGIYQFKFLKKPTKTESKQVQFTVIIDSDNTVFNFDNTAFCGMQYDRLPDNLTLYNGYFNLSFWALPEYPCGMVTDTSNNSEDTAVIFSGLKYLLRLQIINPRKILAIVYYEFGVGGADIESKISVEDKNDKDAICNSKICVAQAVLGTGIFELTLQKIGKSKEMKPGSKTSKSISF